MDSHQPSEEQYLDGEEEEQPFQEHQEYRIDDQEEQEQSYPHQELKQSMHSQQQHKHVSHETYRVHQQQQVRYPNQNQNDLSFQRDPQMLMKIKANLLFNINEQRIKQGFPIFYEDITSGLVAMQYAQFLKGNEPNQASLQKFKKLQKIDEKGQKQKQKQSNQRDYFLSYIVSKYQQDAQITKQFSFQYFMQIGYLFFQVQQYKKYIFDKKSNHIGIGIASDQRRIVICYYTTWKAIAITEITEKKEEPNRVEIKGKVLDSSVGIYAWRLLDHNTPFDAKSGFRYSGPQKITFNKNSRQFTTYIQIDKAFKQKCFLQIYTRGNPDSIVYGKAIKDNIDFGRFLTMRNRAVFIQFPDPRYRAIQNQLKIKQEQTKKSEYQISVIPESLTEKKEEIKSEEQSKESESQFDSMQIQHKEPQNSNVTIIYQKQIRQQLEIAIQDAKRAYQQLLADNKSWQQKIKSLKTKSSQVYVDKGGQMAMNQHKYINTLTQVHQTRLDLKQTQQKYTAMANQLQNKLKDKKQKCNQIRVAFLELKRDIANRAAYSRTEKEIPKIKIQTWEFREAQLNQKLQNARLQILKHRNALAKNQKTLKKKQQLAEGLHLIDFEQLKIENQNYNQKIQQRNEDLHKLKKHSSTTIQILTHTRQKLKYVTQLAKKKEQDLSELKNRDTDIRKRLNQIKKQSQAQRKSIQIAKQQTQIINSQQLVIDFKKRKKHIVDLRELIGKLENEEIQMMRIIEQYKRQQKKNSLQK